MRNDWTRGPAGRSNTSHAFREAVAAVADVLHSHRLGTDVGATARVIVARLAHTHGLMPAALARTKKKHAKG